MARPRNDAPEQVHQDKVDTRTPMDAKRVPPGARQVPPGARPTGDETAAPHPTPRGETTKWGIGGATPAESALNLRLAFAIFGFLLFAGLAAYSVTLSGEGNGRLAWPIVLSALALFALINVVVVVIRRRQRAQEERRRYGHEIDHGIFE